MWTSPRGVPWWARSAQGRDQRQRAQSELRPRIQARETGRTWQIRMTFRRWKPVFSNRLDREGEIVPKSVFTQHLHSEIPRGVAPTGPGVMPLGCWLVMHPSLSGGDGSPREETWLWWPLLSVQTQAANEPFFFFFMLFRVKSVAYGSVQARGQIKLQLPATAQPQQCKIQALSATYIAAHSNPRSLTH